MFMRQLKKVKTLLADHCTRVFWDVVDFPFPEGLAPETIYHRMKLILEKMGCINHYLSIMAYVNNSEIFPDKSAYEKAGINIVTQRERHRFMLRDIAWWEVDSTFTSSFRFRGKNKITFMVISMPDDNSPSPKLVGTTVSFKWLYHCLLQTGDLQDPKRMKMTREAVPLYYSPIQTTLPDEPIPQMLCPGVFLDLPPLRRCYDPVYINSYVRRSMGFNGDFSIMVYIDDRHTSFPDGWADAFTQFGITMIPQRADPHARAHRMSVDIVLWAMDHPATYFQPRDLFVFSDNVKVGTDFYNALEALGDRYYNVRVLPPPDLDVSMPHQIFSNHMPRISREEAIGFSSGLASLYNQDFDMSQIHVFWDVQSCPTDISIILPVLREKGYHGRVLLRPYLPYQGDEPLLGYRDDGYARVPSIKVEGDSYAAIARMLLDILFWAMNHDDLPQNLIFISQPSKDIDIVIQALERRDTANQTLLESPCRTITDLSRKLKRSPVIIFWLVDSCPSNPYEFRNKFSSTLEDKGYADYESVTAYVEEGKNSDEVVNVCRKSGLQVSLSPEGDEFGKFSLMLLDMINWTQASGAPFNFLVISKPFRDAMCDSVFKDVKSRGFNVLFEMVDYMVTFGSSLWSAKSILDTSFSFSSQELA
ncbi:hypothetical protein HID58_076272 [Brassica napus]|uniref:NYN domain-containing protein n=1 Tax=Brassica napus TaxID=3708 RepID=A0ABQ7YQ96_BRANA|nr:hypothetical protein HID58_076272 [Brassica napus]